MNNADFIRVVDEQLTMCRELLVVKGKEYDADTEDRLHSFKVAAEMQHVTPMQALAGMMAKHTVSIYDMCAENNTNIAKWDEKITDSINYLLLLRSLVREELETSKTVLYANGKEVAAI